MLEWKSFIKGCIIKEKYVKIVNIKNYKALHIGETSETEKDYIEAMEDMEMNC